MLVEYFSKNSPVEPTVDNNWKIVGIDLQLDNPERAEIIKKINAGEIESPKNKAYNLGGAEVQGNLIFDGNAADVATVTGADNETYYRLREVAALAAGTKGAFDVTWTPETGVTIVKGTDYTAETAPAAKGEAVSGTLTVTVGEETEEITVVNVGDSNYVSAAGLTALLGVLTVEADGVLTVSVPVNTGIGG